MVPSLLLAMWAVLVGAVAYPAASWAITELPHEVKARSDEKVQGLLRQWGDAYERYYLEARKLKKSGKWTGGLAASLRKKVFGSVHKATLDEKHKRLDKAFAPNAQYLKNVAMEKASGGEEGVSGDVEGASRPGEVRKPGAAGMSPGSGERAAGRSASTLATGAAEGSAGAKSLKFKSTEKAQGDVSFGGGAAAAGGSSGGEGAGQVQFKGGGAAGDVKFEHQPEAE